MYLTFTGTFNHIDGYCYDGAGNLLDPYSCPGGSTKNQYYYDGFGNLLSPNYNSTGANSYTVDALGHRIGKWSGSTLSNEYLYGTDGNVVAELDSSRNRIRTNVYAGGQFIAELKGNVAYFRFNDHLGTIRMELGTDGCQSSYTNLPFGDGLSTVTNGCTDATNYHFTGKERDTESGNDYFFARYYGSSLARFLSPDDDSDQNPPDPQSWNLYSYVHNNPLTNTDPDGHAIQICTTQNGTQHCTDGIDDDAYKAAQQSKANGGLTGTSLADLQNSATGTGEIKDSNGNVVGTVKWTADNSGIQGPQAIQAFGQIATTGNGAIKFFGEQMAWNLAGGLAGHGIGLAVEALRGSEAAVDLANISNKILRQMISRNWTTKEIADVVERGVAHEAINKATGGAATEFVDAATGRFVVVDNSTKQVIQVSGSGHLPNYLLK